MVFDKEAVRRIEEQGILNLFRTRVDELIQKGNTRPQIIEALEEKYQNMFVSFHTTGHLPLQGFDGPSCTGGE